MMPWYLEIPVFVCLMCAAVPIGCVVGGAVCVWIIDWLK